MRQRSFVLQEQSALLQASAPLANIARFPARDARLVHADGFGNLCLRHGLPQHC